MIECGVKDLVGDTEVVKANMQTSFIVTDEVITNIKQELGLEDIQVSEWMQEEELETVR